jgi:type II secretory pathway pseudopilin PulG
MTLRQRSSCLILAVMALAFFPILPLQAQTVDELQRQLEAQQQINAQLRQRVITLEETVETLLAQNDVSLAGQVTDMANEQEPLVVAADAVDDTFDESDLGALEQALVQRGSAVLPPWTAQIISGASWGHSGSSAFGSESDTYTTTLSGRMGLPMGAMIDVSVPYVVRAENFNGDNSGIGDLSISLSKQLLTENASQPSLIASFSYVAPTGADLFETAVPVGSGFHSLQGTLSAVKSVDPVAFYGDLSYSDPFSRTVQGTKFEPGSAIGVGVGSTLAATPEIALSLGVNFAFVGDFEVDGVSVDDTDATIGTVSLGAGFLLSQKLYLSLAGQFGVTDDASDLGVSVALAMRF